jgi:hypothetical protein
VNATTLHQRPVEADQDERRAPLVWPVGLGVLLTAVFLVLRVVSVDEDVVGIYSAMWAGATRVRHLHR